MIHIVGGQGIIGLHLKKELEAHGNLIVQESGNWNFSNVAKEDSVFYLRAVSSPLNVTLNPVSSKVLNVTKTKEAIQTILSCGARIIFASSDVVYGDTENSIAREETITRPYGEYAIQKASVEEEFRYESNFLSLRISSVVGEGSKLRKLLMSQDNVEIFDPVIRTPIHARDFAALCSKLLTSNFRKDFPNGILNVGGSAFMSIFEIATLEAKALGVKEPKITQRTALDKACRPGTVCMSTKKAQEFSNLTLDLSRYYA